MVYSAAVEGPVVDLKTRVQIIREVRRAVELVPSRATSPTPTVDGRNPAPPESPKNHWNDDSPVITNQHWFPMVSNWCERISSIHTSHVGPDAR